MDIGVDTPQEPESAIPKVAARPRFDPVELGTTMRETRVALGHDLGEVANEIRIRNVYLQAIEDGRLGDLPGHAYATGFLRAYGDYLGLDGRDIVARYKASGGAGAGHTDLHLPSPVEEGRLPTASVLVLAALLAVCAYGGWYYLASTGEDPAERVAALPDRLAALVGKDGKAAPVEGSEAGPAVIGSDPTVAPTGEDTTPTEGEASPPAAERERAAAEEGEAATAPPPARETTIVAAPAAPAAPAAASRTPTAAPTTAARSAPTTAARSAPTTAARPAPTTPARPAPTTVARLAPPKPARPAPVPVPAMPSEATTQDEDAAPPDATAMVEPQAGGAGIPSTAERPAPMVAGSRIVLRASTDSWVEVRADGTDPLYSGLLRRGDTYTVPERPGLTMITGNAGGIEILVDGKAIPRLGPPGAVRRDVVLDAESLLHSSRE